MLGVLLASDDATQQTHVLKAFSGQVSACSLTRAARVLRCNCALALRVTDKLTAQMNGAWVVPGWAPPLGSVRHDNSPVYSLA